MPVGPVGPEEKELIIIHCYRSLPVMEAAFGRVEQAHFSYEMEVHLQILWEVSRLWFEEHHGIMNPSFLIACVARQMTARGPAVTDQVTQAVISLVNKIRDFPDAHLTPSEVINNILQRFINDRVVRPLLAAAARTDADYPQVIANINEEFSRSVISSARPVDPFRESPSDAQMSAPREPTGCNIIDYLLEGGPRRQDLIGILGFSGGGKTLLALQMSVEVARTRRHVCFFTYERPVVTDLRDCVWSYAANVHRGRIEGHSLYTMDRDVREAILGQRAMLEGYMHCFDMNDNEARTGFGGIPEIENCVRRESQEGRAPAIVVIDWLYYTALRYMGRTRTKNSGREEEIYNVLMTMGAALKGLARRNNCVVVAVNQFSAEAGSRKSGVTSQYDSMGNKSFPLWMDLCINIGPKGRPDEPVEIVSTKGRSVATSSCRAFLRGEFNRFDMTDEEFVPSTTRDGTRHLVRRSAMDLRAQAGNDALDDRPPVSI